MKLTSATYTRITLLFVFAVLVLCAPDVVFAQTADIDKGGNAIGEMLLRLSAVIFGLAGAMFDYAITKLVVETGQMLGTGTNLGNTINTTWAIIRDLCNLAFVFFFFYVGIKTIIERDTSFAKQTIAKLIIGALLINFSLFFTKVVIDLANVAAVEIYNVLTPSENVQPGMAFTRTIKINELYGTTIADANGGTKTLVVADKNFTWYIIASIFLLITAFTFFISSIMLIVRFVILTLGMILSPFMFVLGLIPASLGSLAKSGKNFQQEFIQSAFFPVVFLFLILIAINVLNSIDIGTASSIIQIGSTDDGQYTYILRFAIAIAFMIAAQKTSKMVSKKAASVTSSWAKKGIGAAAFGGAALAGRQVIGRGAHAIAQDSAKMADLQRRAAEGSTSARLTLKTIAGAQKASFDARQSRAMKAAASTGIGKSIGITDFGTGVSKLAEKHKENQGFAGRNKAAVKEVAEIEEAKAKILPKFDEKDPLVARRIEDQKEAAKAARDAKTNLKSKTNALAAIQKTEPSPSATDAEKSAYENKLKEAKSNVDKAESESKAADEKLAKGADLIEREKNRHQVGTTFRESDYTKAEERKAVAEGKLADAQTKLGNPALDDIGRNKVQEEIENAQKNIATENEILKHKGKTIVASPVEEAEKAEADARALIQAKFDAIRRNRTQANAGPQTPEETERLNDENRKLTQELEAAQKAHGEAKKKASGTYGGRIGYAQSQGRYSNALRGRLKGSTQGGIEDRAKQYTRKPDDKKKG